MGVEELPNSGNKFTGSRMIVPGVGLEMSDGHAIIVPQQVDGYLFVANFKV